MNYYFLLEDEKSFLKVLPAWFKLMDFKCTRVPDIKHVTENNYVLQSGRGVTQLVTKIIFDTVDTLLENPNTINKLVILLDTEEENEEYRKNQVFSKLREKYDVSKFDFEVLIYVCNHCFESWLLGKEGLYPKDAVNENSDFYPYYSHYDIENNDPENMRVPIGVSGTTAKYHFHYLCELFRYRKIRYSKSNPRAVMEEDYFDGMRSRIEKTEHINSFKQFVQFICKENDLMNSTI